MAQGDQGANATLSGYYAPSRLRYLALVVVATGLVLTFASDRETLSTYVLAAGLLIAAADDLLRREPALAGMVAGLAVMIVASYEDWTVAFYLSAVMIAVGAAFALRRALRRTK